MNAFYKKALKLKKKELKKIRAAFSPEVVKAAAFSVGGEFRSVEYAIETAKRFPVLVELKSRFFPHKYTIENFQPLAIARALISAGMETAVIVATDSEFMGGDPSWINLVKMHTTLPVLQTDFFIHPDQMYQSKAIGADAVILDARLMTGKENENICEAAVSMGLEAFLQVYSADELENLFTDELSGIVLNLERLPDGKLDFALLHAAMKPASAKTFFLARCFPNSEVELKELVGSGVHGVILNDSFWHQTEDFLAVYKSIVNWV